MRVAIGWLCARLSAWMGCESPAAARAADEARRRASQQRAAAVRAAAAAAAVEPNAAYKAARKSQANHPPSRMTETSTVILVSDKDSG